MANSLVPVLVRIRGFNGEAKDWLVPSDINFRMVLDVMSQVLPGLSPLPTAFEYEDEDNDRITVCSDEELMAMLSYCRWRSMRYGATVDPMAIFPKASKRRNTLKLEVNPMAPPTPSSRSNPGSGSGEGLVRSGSFRRTNEQALVKLLSEGQVSSSDLHYLEILGHGSGGTVYRTFHQPSKIVMAVKVLALDVTLEEQKQIKAELEILHKCNSWHIIGFYGAFFSENRISICTEYMDGGSMEHYGAVPEEVLSRVVVSVVRGLSYLWSMKIMHRDIKPSNILVNTQGQVKLCDFGVSVQLLTSLTKTFIGTNAYMAPERILGGEYGIHSEVWSLGVTILELSLGRFPYLQEGGKPNSLMPFDLLQCIVNEKPPLLPRDRFSPQLIDFTAQCMQKLPKARPGIDGLLQHPFLVLHQDKSEEVVSVWVRRLQEQMRILSSKRFPSDCSLASNSSSTSAWSGHSARTHQSAHAAHYNSGHTLSGHATLGGGAFQFMEPS